MTKYLRSAILAISAVLPLGAQQSYDPAFEAASVKPNPTGVGVRLHSFPGDRFVATNVPLRDLVVLAYGEAGQMLPDTRLVGGPAWLNSDRFDVNAKVSAGSINSVAQKQLMLRTLLTDRFKLSVHYETRALPAYALVKARSDGTLGPRISRANVDCEPLLARQPGRRDRCILFAVPSGKLEMRGQTMSALASALSQLFEREVLDRTGLTGGFDADADFNTEGLPGMMQLADGNRRDAPSLSTALEEQLGLKLESSRAALDVVVIDHVERPTPD